MNINRPALMKSAGVGAAAGVLLAIGTFVPIVNYICCCLGIFMWGAVGASYGYFDEKEGNPIDMGSYAIGGAISAVVGSVVWVILYGTGLALVTGLVFGIGALSDPTGLEETLPGLAAMGGMSVLWVGVVACIALILDAVFGALGGLIYAAIQQNQNPRPYNPPPVM